MSMTKVGLATAATGISTSLVVSAPHLQSSFAGWWQSTVGQHIQPSQDTTTVAINDGDGMERIYFSMKEYYAKYPQYFGKHIIAFAVDMTPELSAKFGFKYTDSDEVISSNMVIDSAPMAAAARGTLATKITVSQESSRVRLQFRTQGLKIDLYTIDKPEGRALFEAGVRQVVANFRLTVVLDLIVRARDVVFGYNKPADKIPEYVPTTFEHADAIKRRRHHFLSRPGIGIKEAIAACNMCFSPMDEQYEGMMVSRNVLDIIESSESILHQAVSGVNPETLLEGKPKSIRNKLIVFPNLKEGRSNDWSKISLQTASQCGSAARFVNDCMDLPKGEWRTNMTDVQKAVWSMNGFVKFSKRAAFHQAMGLEFNEIDGVKGREIASLDMSHHMLYQYQKMSNYNKERADHGTAWATYMGNKKISDYPISYPGQLNTQMILQMIEEYDDNMKKMRTKANVDNNDNKKKYHWAIAYDDRSHSAGKKLAHKDNMRPIHFIGELDPAHMSNKVFMHMIKTTIARLKKYMTEAEMQKTENVVGKVRVMFPDSQLFDTLNFYTNSVNKLTPTQKVIAEDLLKLIYSSADDNVFALAIAEHIEKKMDIITNEADITAALTAIVKDMERSAHVFDVVKTINQLKNLRGLFNAYTSASGTPKAIAQKTYEDAKKTDLPEIQKEIYESIEETEFKFLKTLGFLYVSHNHYKNYLVGEFPVYKNREVFLKTKSPLELLIGQALMLTPISLPVLTAMCDMDIDTPLSALILSPWEQQNNESVIAYGQGSLGTQYFNTPNERPEFFESTDPISKKQLHVAEMQFGTVWQNPRRACIIPNVAGSDVVGGNGDKWIMHHPSVRNTSGHEAKISALKQLCYDARTIGDFSNIAVLVGANECIDEVSHDHTIHICGYPTRHSYLGVMHDHDDFYNLQQNTFQWMGCAWFTYVFNPQDFIELLPKINYDKHTHAHVDLFQSYNTICHPTTLIITNYLKQEKMLEGRHERGHQGVNCLFAAESYRRIGHY
jgi:hypothetical protein